MIAGESDGADCYLALGGRNDCRRERRGRLLPETFCQHNDLVCGSIDGVVANGERADFCGISQQGPSENRRSGGGNPWSSGNIRTLPPVTVSVKLTSDII